MACKEPCNKIVAEIAEFLANEAHLRASQDGRPADGRIEFRFGPAMLIHPVTKKLDLPANPKFRQIFLHGVRIGYIHSVKPGGKIALLRPWPAPQLEALREAIMEELVLQGFDVDTPRRFWAPKHDGLLGGGREEAEAELPEIDI